MDVIVQKVILTSKNDNEFAHTVEARVEGLTKKAYGWSKYGGVKLGLIQEDKLPEWSCQACGEKQTSELPSYMFEFSPDEFIRICSVCEAKKLTEHIQTLEELLALVRKVLSPWY